MKKFLLASIIVATAICSYAADLKLTGDAYVRGSMVANQNLAEEDESSYNYYDYDFNLYAAVVINEQASVNLKLTFDTPYYKGGTTETVPRSDAAAQNGQYLSVEHAYLKYKFSTGTILDAGIMSGGTWATKFGETEGNAMRLKVTQVFSPELTVLAIIQKNEENGAKKTGTLVGDNGLDQEKNDSDTYYLAAILKAGPLAIKPLLLYGRDGVNQEDAATADKYMQVTYSAQLGIDFNMDMIGLEAEGQYLTKDYDGEENTTGTYAGEEKKLTTFGFYANVFAKIDTIKVGFVYAYASADEEKGTQSMGNEFNVCIVMDETKYDGTGLSGLSVYKVYAEANLAPITIGVAGAYIANNRDWDITTAGSELCQDATAMEFDVSFTYAIDANISYTLDGGYAMTSDWHAKGIDADMYVVRHKMSAKF